MTEARSDRIVAEVEQAQMKIARLTYGRIHPQRLPWEAKVCFPCDRGIRPPL